MPELGFITGLTTGWLLGGLSAAMVPVAVHLLARRVAPTIVFPAAGFIRAGVASRARAGRLRDALLLLIRMAIIATIALAFDRPLWVSHRPAPAVAQGVDVVIVLDASASMTRVAQGRSLYADAREQAITLLRSLDAPMDGAAVVYATRSPRAALPELTSNVEALVAMLARSEPTYEHANLAGAIELAAALPAPRADDESPRAKRLVVFADLQRSQWQGMTLGRLPALCSAELRPIGPQGATPNIALSDCSIEPQRPAPGERATVSVRVTNFGDLPVTTNVTLRTANISTNQSVALAPDSSQTLRFPVEFHKPGVEVLRVAVSDEAFTADNEAQLVVSVRAKRRIALVTSPDPHGALTSALFVRTAIAPTSESAYTVETLAPNELAHGNLGRFDALVLAAAGDPPADALEVIAQYVERGGGLVWLIDSPEAMQAASRFNESGASSARLPVRAAAPFQVLPPGEGVFPSRVADEYDALAGLAAPGRAALLKTRYRAVAPMELSERGVALVWLKPDQPLIAWADVGRGRVVTICADLSPRTATLASSAQFPALVHELLAFITDNASAPESVMVGEPFVLTLDADASISSPIVDDMGRRVGVLTAEDGVRLSMPARRSPGVAEAIDSQGAVVARGVVVMDRAESDTQTVDADEASRLLAGASGSANTGEPRRMITSGAVLREEGVDLWPWLLVTAMALLAIESAVAGSHRQGRQRSAFS